MSAAAEASFIAWSKAWTDQQTKLGEAMTSGDFSEVQPDPLSSLEGDVAPTSQDLDQKIEQLHTDESAQLFDRMTLQRQCAMLDSARKARVSRRLGFRAAIRHAAHEAGEPARVSAALTQQVAGIRKVVTG